MENEQDSRRRRERELQQEQERMREDRRNRDSEDDGWDQHSNDSRASEESKGTRFDRMIMDAIGKSAEREIEEGGESGLTNSFRSILDSMAGTFQDRLANRRIDNDPLQINSSGSSPGLSGNWLPRFGGGGSTLMPDIQQVSWALLAALAAVFVAAGVWVGLRIIFQPPKRDCQ